MKWFDNWFAKKCRQAWDDTSSPVTFTGETPGYTSNNLDGRCTRFNVFKADGGFVIQHWANHGNHGHTVKETGPDLTIVTQGSDLGTAVNHIMTMDALRS